MQQNQLSPFGIKQGAFKVDSNGSATYTFPIEVPPGIAGTQPHLALNYNHSLGNGICGVGWTLSGLSSICRTNAIMAIDGFCGSINYDANDRFALDGQRLINIQGNYGEAGTVYYNENHNWQQIIAGATPQDGFTVYMKNGEVRTYGTTPDSCIMALNAGYVREWALASVQDLNGNRVEYKYTNTPGNNTNEGAYYLSQILYTVTAISNACFSVNFIYSPRPDNLVTYLGGYAVNTSYLLSSVQTFMGSQLVRSYNLAYTQSLATQLSRLSTITLADANGNEMPPLSLAWQDVPQPSFNAGLSPSRLLNANDVVQTMPVDINGDGITDILQFYRNNNSKLFVVSFIASQQGQNINYISSNENGQGLGFYENFNIYTADVNGDGLNDILIVYPGGNDNNYLCIDTYINNGSSFNEPVTTTTTNEWLTTDSLGFFTMDANGDGRVDLVQAFNVSGILNFNIYLSEFVGREGNFSKSINCNTRSEFTAPQVWPVDVNNDGMVDMVICSQNDNVYQFTSFVSTGTASGIEFLSKAVTTATKVPVSDTVTILPADVNGDGLVDILQIAELGSGSMVMQSFISNANGAFSEGSQTILGNQQFGAANLYPLSINGHAQTNIVASWLNENVWKYCLFSSTASGTFMQGSTVTTPLHLSQTGFFAGDATGEGKAGLFSVFSDSQNYINILPCPSAGEYPDLLSTITDMLGNLITINYLPLTNADVYSKGTTTYPSTGATQYPYMLSPAQFPVQHVQGGAMYVVASYSVANQPALNRFSYLEQYQLNYSGACIDLDGRGWQGFATVTRTNTLTGLTIQHNFLQAFPYTGCLAGVSKYAGSNVLMKQSINTYQAVSYPSPSSTTSAAWQVLKSGVLDYFYNNGEANFETLTARSFAYDEYGNQNAKVWWGSVNYINPQTISNTGPFPALVPQTPENVLYTYSQYLNNKQTAGWALGYLLVEKQTNIEANTNLSVFQTGDYNLVVLTYTGSYNLASRGIWDNQNACLLTTTFTYDGFGNKTSQTVPGNSTTQYTYETVYNTYLNSVTSPTNEQQMTLSSFYGFDPRFGTRIAWQDANGNTTILSLDSFGRVIAEQEPVPQGCSQSDANQCSSYVTGTKQFGNASVLTLLTRSYFNDGNACIYLLESKLQQFPQNTSRVFQNSYKFIDGKGRSAVEATQTGDANYAVILKSYAPGGKLAAKSLPFYSDLPAQAVAPYTITYTYDAFNRITSQSMPAGQNNELTLLTTWQYNSWQQTTVTRAAGTPQSYQQVLVSQTFNGKTQYIQSIIPADGNATTQFSYDALGRMLSSIDPNGLQNLVQYDSIGRKLNYNNPDQNPLKSGAGALVYQYSAANGLVQQIADASGATVNYTYDGLGRIIAEMYSDGRTCNYIYDTAANGAGHVASVVITCSGATESSMNYAYDCYGNREQETLVIDGKSFVTVSVFDPQQRLVQQTNSDNSVLTRTYQYSMLTGQQLDSVSIQYPLADYQANGRFGSMNYLNGNNDVLQAGYTYNAAGTLFNETLANSEENLLDFTFVYDALNQLTGLSESIGNTSQAYNYTNRRLTSLSGSAGMPAGNYDYDNAGRLTEKDNNNYSYNESNCPITISGNVNYSASLDACGRLLSRNLNGVVTGFAYSASGSLTSISSGGNIIRTINYNSNGKRLMETFADGSKTIYVHNNYHIHTDAQGNSSVAKYIADVMGSAARIVSTQAGDQVNFYRRDRKKNITHILNSTGTIETQLVYDGFGVPTLIGGTQQSLPAGPMYEGRYYDQATGLYYFGARYYDPGTGTFLTPDSRLGARNKITPGAWNRFAFELNSPVNHIDPSGHLSLGADIAIISAVLVITTIGVALTPFTGGASDVAAAEADGAVAGGSIELTSIGGAEAGTEAGGAGLEAGEVGVESTEAGSSVEGAANAEESASRGVWGVIKRVGTNAIVGALKGGLFSGGEYLISGSGKSWSGFFSAVEQGAVSGAVADAVAEELTDAIPLTNLSSFDRMLVTGGIGAAKAEVETITESVVFDKQLPSAGSLAESAAKGFAMGAATSFAKGSWSFSNDYD